MSAKEHNIITFRHKVQQLDLEGAFKAPEDALIFSIKERQAYEITMQINSSKYLDVIERHPTSHYQFAKKGSHLANIFFRDDYLAPDDYGYLFSVMKITDRAKVLETLANNSCLDHDILNGQKSPWIKAFLEDSATRPFELPRSMFVSEILQEGRLVKLLMAYFNDPEKVVALHLGIERMLEEDTRAQRNHIEVTHLKRAGTLESDADIEQWLKAQKVVEGLRRENQKEIVGEKQSNVLLNQIKAVIQLETSPVEHKASVASSIKAMIREDLEFLIQVMKLPASKAMETFGKADTKSGGKAMPGRLSDFALLIDMPSVDPEQRKQVIGLMVSRLCEVNRKNMVTKEVTAFITDVKDKVDWKEVVASMNAKGRKGLMEIFPDTGYYRAYLKRDERGKTLESELGL